MKPGSVLVAFNPLSRERNGDVLFPYRASSDMLYLSGLQWPNSAFLISSEEEYPQIFLPYVSAQERQWSADFPHPEEIASALSLRVDRIGSWNDFLDSPEQWLGKSSTLYLDWNSDYFPQLMEKLKSKKKKSRPGEFITSEIVDLSSLLSPLRLEKDAGEISLLRKAGSISAAAHNSLMSFVGQNRAEQLTEGRLKAELTHQMQILGAMETSYPHIVATGKHSTVLHYEKSDGIVRDGDLILVDSGAEWFGYAGDISRTFPANGKFNPIQKELYQIVLSAQKKAIGAAKPGVTLETLHDIAVREMVAALWDMGLFRKIAEQKGGSIEWIFPQSVEEVIEQKIYRQFYMHRTSHWIGLDVHDPANDTQIPLTPGMVFSVEPGLYFPANAFYLPDDVRGIGIRIEDDIVITETGSENLTHEAVKEITEIETFMKH